MTVIRLILLVAVLGGLMLLLAQNWSPAIPLVFLGLRTQPVSLAIWMLLCAAAGAFTSLVISGLVQLSSRAVSPQPQRISYEPSEDSPRVNKRTDRENPRENNFEDRVYPPPPSNSPQPSNRFEDDYDDWDLDRKVSDDWDFEEKLEQEYFEPSSRPEYTKIQDDRDYEDFPQPENDRARITNPYPDDDRDLKDSGTEKTESVYDADYRVIVPPPAASTTSQDSQNSQNNQDDDDWGFLDEDFAEDKSGPK
ncbi:MAG: LapA family protein [Rivularia sp. (in: Bacteria)]|nr:LapA family protein [Rivularia sp. MS3]